MDYTREAVVHTMGKQNTGAAKRDEKLMGYAFGEALRVLKPGR